MRQAAALMGVFHIAGLTTDDKQMIASGWRKNIYARALVRLLKEFVYAENLPFVVHPTTVSIEDEDSVYLDAEFLVRLQQAGLTKEFADAIVWKPDNVYAILLVKSFHDEEWRAQVLAEDEARVAKQQRGQSGRAQIARDVMAQRSGRPPRPLMKGNPY